MGAKRLMRVAMAIAALAMLTVACGGGAAERPASPPTVVAAATAAANLWAGVAGIVDAGNHGWPRQVTGINGMVTIKQQPQRILTVSLGHDEVTYGLVPASRVVAVGAFTKNADSSNVAVLSAKLPTIGRDPEPIIAQRPDVVIASAFTSKDLVTALGNAGVAVVQTQLRNDHEGRIQDMLLMGYIFGEEERALALAKEVRGRYEALRAVAGKKAQGQQPRVMSTAKFSDKLYTAGAESTEGAIIEAAGGFNVAAEAGLKNNPVITLEGIVKMRPEVIIITQPADSGEPYKQELLASAALVEVPAIKNKAIYIVPIRWYTTLSYWNLAGAEHLARVLWPQDFAGKEVAPFTFPQ
ncbi:MAG: ABC transporter substrate-binding protein [Dehalococcoidia bacterium]|nr:ABC transporter substrate-binding protein [Dehalococcoidia bacterium]